MRKSAERSFGKGFRLGSAPRVCANLVGRISIYVVVRRPIDVDRASEPPRGSGCDARLRHVRRVGGWGAENKTQVSSLLGSGMPKDTPHYRRGRLGKCACHPECSAHSDSHVAGYIFGLPLTRSPVTKALKISPCRRAAWWWPSRSFGARWPREVGSPCTPRPGPPS